MEKGKSFMDNFAPYDPPVKQGLIQVNDHADNRYVSAYGAPRYELSTTDQAMLNSVVIAASEITARRQTNHLVSSDDNAITQAQASLVYSTAYTIPIALITGGICLLGYWNEGGGGGFYTLLWLISWGICTLIVLALNRQQGLWHSASGIAHHEIESRERVALHAIDKHIALIEKRWERQS